MSNDAAPKTFAELRSRSSQAVERLQEAVKSTSNSGWKDERFYNLKQDGQGNGWAIIRFLPAPAGEPTDWVQVFNHRFKVGNRWFRENCPTTIHGFGTCPVCEAMGPLWEGSESEKKIASTRGRKKDFITNILVVKDVAQPENEGKVFLFKFGVKIWDKIKAKIMPDEAFGDQPVPVFDPWGGANFRLKVKKVKDFNNYDDSAFDSPSAMFDGDDSKIEEAWGKCYSLQAYLDPKLFKDYDTLAKEYTRVSGEKVKSPSEEVLEAPKSHKVEEEAERQELAKPTEQPDDEPKNLTDSEENWDWGDN